MHAMYYTYYDYLELAPGASPARIEAAYHDVKQRVAGDADEAIIREIHRAYAVLSDAAERKAYDVELQRIATEADNELKAALDAHATQAPRRVQEVPAPLVAAMTAWAA